MMTHVHPDKQEIIPGYCSRIVDGNKIAAADRRLEVQRNQSGGSIAVLGD